MAPNEQILKMLAIQNQGAWTDRWSIINRSQTARGLNITFGIDEEQLASIAAAKFKLHFAAGIAIFRDISKKPEGSQAQNVDTGTENEMDKDSIQPPESLIESIDITSDDETHQQNPIAMETNVEDEQSAVEQTLTPTVNTNVANITETPKAPTAGQ